MRRPTSNALTAAPCRRRTGSGLESSCTSAGYAPGNSGGGRHPGGDRYPDALIADALRRFHREFTYREISAGLMRRHKTCAAEISPSTVMRRVDQYTEAATAEADELQAHTRDTGSPAIYTWITGEPPVGSSLTQVGELSPNLAPVIGASCGVGGSGRGFAQERKIAGRAQKSR